MALLDVVREVTGMRETNGQDTFQPSSLRRKPGEGLVVCYQTASTGRLVTVSLSEQTLAGRRLSTRLTSVDLAEFQGTWPGIMRCPRIGMIVQAFPHDAALPGLRVAAEPDESLTEALANACRLVLGAPVTRVAGISVLPVRYKPGKRCVLRYQVTADVGTGPGDRHQLVFYGKVYRDPAQAVSTYRLAETLWNSLTTRTLAPRPLALIEKLNLVLSEGAGGVLHTERLAGEDRSSANPTICAATPATRIFGTPRASATFAGTARSRNCRIMVATWSLGGGGPDHRQERRPACAIPRA